jgi:DNA primase
VVATQEHIEIVSQQVESHYSGNPDLIVHLLGQLGAANIRLENGQIRSTCPLHMGDREDSFVVWLDRDVPIWRCFTDCGDKGRLGKLVMKKFQCRFVEALKWLAQVGGLQVDIDGSVDISPDVLEDLAISRLNSLRGIGKVQTANHFPESMVQDSMRRAPGYFLTRFPQWLLQHFQVGFVPGGTWVRPDVKDPTKMQGWFEDRESIPWRDIDGRLIGFAGRRIDGVKHRKYMTLPGTVKSLALYGLNDPKVRQAIIDTKELNLVEGYCDQWRAYQHEVYNTTAVGGVELSQAQLFLIRSFPLRRINIYFDGDTPGQTVAARMAEQLAETNAVFNATPPDGSDPGDLIVKEAFLQPILNATEILSRRL